MAINPEEGFLTQSADSTAAVATSSMKPSSQREFIIVVPPSGGNNVITMYNAQEFIEHGKYIPSEEIRRVGFFVHFHHILEEPSKTTGNHSQPRHVRPINPIPLYR